MAQKALRSKAKPKSSGAQRKHVGAAKKKHTYTKSKATPVKRAQAKYTASVEAAMASRVPSDQRSKLSIIKPSGPISKQKHMKKPLTRGRTRKGSKKH